MFDPRVKTAWSERTSSHATGMGALTQRSRPLTVPLGVHVRLIRNNDDPKLIADLERLAGAESVAIAPPEVIEADVERLAAASVTSRADVPIDDPFVRRFVQGSIHLRKYAPFYAGAGLWLGAMLLIDPVGGGRGDVADTVAAPRARAGIAAPVAATSVAEVAASDVDVDTVGAPVFDSFGGSTFDSADAGEFADFGSSDVAEDTSTDFAFDDADESFDDSEFETFEDEEEAEPEPLTIIESGYASTTGGTPLEQPPAGGGLPITTAGGNTTKYSFVRLSGGKTTISMQEAADGNLNSATATLEMCPLTTASWTGGSGKAMSAAPAYDSFCAKGTRSDAGVWSFDLLDFAPVEGSNGFAIVPGTGTAATFQVVLNPMPVEEDGA